MENIHILAESEIKLCIIRNRALWSNVNTIKLIKKQNMAKFELWFTFVIRHVVIHLPADVEDELDQLYKIHLAREDLY